MGYTPQQLTDFLWQNHHLYNFWMVVTLIGVASSLLLLLFDRLIIKKDKA